LALITVGAEARPKSKREPVAHDDQDIIEEIMAGNRHRYSVLVERHQKKLFTFMMRLCRCRHDAEDLTQEAFVRAFERLESFRMDGNFRNWLFAVGLNLYRDMARREAARFEKKALFADGREEISRTTVEDETMARDQSGRLAQALSRLPVRYREVLSLRYENDFSMKEIARITGISVSGAKMRVSRGLRKLKALYGSGQDNG